MLDGLKTSLQSRLARVALATILILSAFVAMTRFFEQIPIEGSLLGVDWTYFYAAVQGGQINLEAGLRILPWSVPALLPFGFLSYRSSWGALALVTLAVLMLSVPPMHSKARRWLAIFLLISSHSALRLMADGNLEMLTIGGAVLVLAGYRRQHPWLMAGGLLLVTAKPQVTWLLVIAVGLLMLRNWPARRWLGTAALVLIVVVPMVLWQGKPWLETFVTIGGRGGPADASLLASIPRLGLPPMAYPIAWMVLFLLTTLICLADQHTLSRSKAGLLMAASVLLAPYCSGISFVSVLAIGIIPLLDERPLWGILLLALTNVQYVIPHGFQVEHSATLLTALTLLAWCVFATHLYRTRPQAEVALQPAL